MHRPFVPYSLNERYQKFRKKMKKLEKIEKFKQFYMDKKHSNIGYDGNSDGIDIDEQYPIDLGDLC